MKYDKIKTCWFEVGSRKTEVKSQGFVTTFLLNKLLASVSPAFRRQASSVFKYLKFTDTKVSAIEPDCRQASFQCFDHQTKHKQST